MSTMEVIIHFLFIELLNALSQSSLESGKLNKHELLIILFGCLH